MAKSFAGAAFNLEPGRVTQMFAPGTQDIFNLNKILNTNTNASVNPNGESFLTLLSPKERADYEIQRQQNAAFSNAFQRRNPAEDLERMLPFLTQMEKLRSETASKVARQKFGDELLMAGVGTLGQAIKNAAAGGDPAVLAQMAQAPIRNLYAYREGLSAYPRQEIPTVTPFAPQPYVSTSYYS
jgi:hypothetical protein